MLNSLARVGILGVTAEHRLAAVEVGQVVDGQRGVGLKGVSAGTDALGALLGARGGLDGDGSAVHVVFLCSRQLGSPSPCVAVSSSGNVRGDGDIVCSCARSVLGRATTLDGQDDRPASGCAGLHIGGQGDLARAASVDSRALEGHADGLACSGGVGNSGSRVECGSISTNLAGVLRRSERACGDRVHGVRYRVRKCNVSVRNAAAYCQHSSSLLEKRRHDEDRLSREKRRVLPCNESDLRE